jgi:hypothetical protein
LVLQQLGAKKKTFIFFFFFSFLMALFVILLATLAVSGAGGSALSWQMPFSGAPLNVTLQPLQLAGWTAVRRTVRLAQAVTPGAGWQPHSVLSSSDPATTILFSPGRMAASPGRGSFVLLGHERFLG